MKQADHIYRTCEVCGREWNVSKQNRDKRYCCPACRKRGNTNERNDKAPVQT